MKKPSRRHDLTAQVMIEEYGLKITPQQWHRRLDHFAKHVRLWLDDHHGNKVEACFLNCRYTVVKLVFAMKDQWDTDLCDAIGVLERELLVMHDVGYEPQRSS